MASPAAPKPTGSPAAGVGPYEMRLPPETGKSKTDYLFDDFAALQDLMGSVKGKVAPAMDAMSDLRSSPDMTRQAIAGIDQDLASKGGPQGLIQFVKQNEDALRQRGVNIDAYMNAIMARAQQ